MDHFGAFGAFRMYLIEVTPYISLCLTCRFFVIVRLNLRGLIDVAARAGNRSAAVDLDNGCITYTRGKCHTTQGRRTICCHYRLIAWLNRNEKSR